MEYVRRDALHVEIVKMQVDFLGGIGAVKEVVTLGVSGIEARIVGTVKESTSRLVTMKYKGTWILWQLGTSSNSKICKRSFNLQAETMQAQSAVRIYFQ